ncbi:MAG: hypothetical protein FJW39_22650 [Acidobacteria bacterium]|nr:hypothetical protein [Acidobacteriota bacterium]
MDFKPGDLEPDEQDALDWMRQRVPRAAGCPTPDALRAASAEALPEDQLAAVNAHKASCAACAALAQSLSLMDHPPPTPLENRRIRARIGLPVEAVPASGPRSAPWWQRWWAAVPAAALAAALAAVWFQGKGFDQPSGNVAKVDSPPQKSEPSKTARISLQPAPLRLTLSQLSWRGEDGNESKEAYLAALGLALKPYRESRWTEAAASLEQLSARYPKAAEPVFYRGVALLLSGNAAGAVVQLEKANQFKDAAFASDLPWYLAAALEQAGRGGDANSLLGSLCAAPGPYQQQACALVKQ